MHDLPWSLALVVVLAGSTFLGCGPQATSSAETPSRLERPPLWSEAEAVWSRYVQHLEQGEGALAADLTAAPELESFSRYRVAALFLDREQLLRMRPEDIVLVLQLRALAKASDLEQMSSRDVFVTLASAGALSDGLAQRVRIGHQNEGRLFLERGEGWLPSPTFVVTPDGPRVHSANVQFQKRWQFRERLGLTRKDVPSIAPERLLSEASRSLNRPPDPAWWTPLRPVPDKARAEARAKLNAASSPGPAKPQTSRAKAPPSEAPPKGRLEAKVIQQTIRDQFEPIRVCYEDGLVRDPTLEGKVVVRFVIERDGSVIAEEHTSDISMADVTECIAVQFLTLEFPEPDGGVVTVTFPLMFSPD